MLSLLPVTALSHCNSGLAAIASCLGKRWHEATLITSEVVRVVFSKQGHLFSQPSTLCSTDYRMSLPQLPTGTLGAFRSMFLKTSYRAAEFESSLAVHEVSQPLYAFKRHDQDEFLFKVARKIKAVALGATDQFTVQEP